MDEVVFERSCSLAVGNDFRFGLGETASRRQKSPHLRCRAGARSQHSTDRRGRKAQVCQHLTVVEELRDWQRNDTPLARTLRPLMCMLAEGVKDEVPGPQLDSVPNGGS